MQLTDNAKEDIENFKKSGDKASLKKLAVLLNELIDHPQTGTGQPEQLKYNFAGCWSRRINKKDRILYQIIEEKMTVILLYASGHYKDK